MFNFVTPGILANDNELYLCRFSLCANGPVGIESNLASLYLTEPLSGFGFLLFKACCLARKAIPFDVIKNLMVLAYEFIDAPIN